MKNGSSTRVEKGANPEGEFAEMLRKVGLDPTEPDEDKKDDWPEIVSARELVTNPGPPPIVLIDKILHRGEKFVLGGSSKTNKTWSGLDLAVSVAAGVPWWGFSTTKAKVLYVNFEIQRYQFSKRIERVYKSKGLKKIPANLDVWNLRGHACDAWAFVQEAIKRLTDQDYGLAIIDPIYKCLGDRNENDASDIANLCNHFERMALKTGAAVMFLAHFSKGNQAGKSSLDRIGGSGVWARDADTIMTITQHREENAYAVETTVRNFPAVAPFGVRWQYPLMLPSGDLDPRALRTGRTPTFNDEDLLKALPQEGATYTGWERAVVAQTGMSQSSFKAKCRSLKDTGKVHLLQGVYRRAIDWDKPPE